MADVCTIAVTDWCARALSQSERERAVETLEAGNVLYCPQLAFDASELHEIFGNADLPKGTKNVSLDPGAERLSGVSGPRATIASRVMRRYASAAHALVTALFERYAATVVMGRTSLRPVEIASRATSWRKDDTRLHVDSFPATPVAGKRILRVFSNVDPRGAARCWRIAEAFEHVASRYVARLARPAPGSSVLRHVLGITKTRRTLYDHYMLQLHDAMKQDEAYQRGAPEMRFDFPAGSTWICYTDQVSHAAIRGAGALEQTFYVPVHAMADASKSPLRTLEHLVGRPLA